MGVVVNIVSAVVSIVLLVVLMVVENVLRADQTLPSYHCRTAVVLKSYWQSWTDKDRELKPWSDGFVTIMRDRGGLLWSGTSAKNDRHSVTWALPLGYDSIRCECICHVAVDSRASDFPFFSLKRTTWPTVVKSMWYREMRQSWIYIMGRAVSHYEIL